MPVGSTNGNFEQFCRDAYAGIPNSGHVTRAQMQQSLDAHYMILSHPDCPESSKPKLKEEIARLNIALYAPEGSGKKVDTYA